MKKNYIFSRHIFISIFILEISFAAIAGSTNKERERLFYQKADTKLVEQFSSGSPVEFFVEMNQQADVSGAYKLVTKEEKGQYVFDVLTSTAERSQAGVISYLKNKGVTFEQLWIVNGIAVTGNAEVAKEIASFSEVKSLNENTKFSVEKPVATSNVAEQDATRAVEWQLTKVKADQVWALGYKGQGAVIGGQDTGYDWTHAAIKKQYRGWNGSTADHNYNWHDAITSGSGSSCGVNLKAPCDDNNHGTHTMGSMVGDDGGSNKIGMAPEAKWIGARNMNAGAGTLNSYLDCFQWFLAPTDLQGQNPKPSMAPHVINNSWGCDNTEGCTPSNWNVHRTAIANLQAAGVVVVISAGNDGPQCSTVKASAAVFDISFSVGSTDNADAMSGFSSRGPVTIDGSNRRKPDISAPGSGIRSCIPGGSYSSMSGTSMAGPQVAGLVALMISANPAIAGQIDTIESIIEKTAVRITVTSQTCGGIGSSTFPNNTSGWGRIDALAAVTKAKDYKNTTGIDSYTNNRVRVYPNPVTDNLIFLFTGVNQEGIIKIYSVEGRILSEYPVSSSMDRMNINLGNLTQGLYFYTLETASHTYNGKFVKE